MDSSKKNGRWIIPFKTFSRLRVSTCILKLVAIKIPYFYGMFPCQGVRAKKF